MILVENYAAKELFKSHQFTEKLSAEQETFKTPKGPKILLLLSSTIH